MTRATTLECHSCGHEFTPGHTDEGCQPCALCVTCTPAACICKEGVALRRQDAAEAEWRWFREHAEAVSWS